MHYIERRDLENQILEKFDLLSQKNQEKVLALAISMTKAGHPCEE